MKLSQAKAPWTPETLALLGKMPDSELARRVGCTRQAVELRRRTGGIKAYGRQQGRIRVWGETELGLFRIYSDRKIATLTGRTLEQVAAKRNGL